MMDGQHDAGGSGPRDGGPPPGLRHHEEFADTVVVPGPNLRSRFVDTEEVDDATELILDADAAGFCPACHRVLPADAAACPDDGTSVVQLPPAAPA